MPNKEFEDISFHPDLQPSAAGAEDIQTHEMMSDAAMVNEALAHGEITSQEALNAFIVALNNRWAAYQGQRVLIAGKYWGERGDQLTEVNADERVKATFLRFGTRTVVDDGGVYQIVCYELGDDSDDDTRYYAETDVHLEFPDLISTQRLEALVAPLLDKLDEVLNDEQNESIDYLLTHLRDVPLYLDLDQRDFGLVYAALAQYLNSVTEVGGIAGMTTSISGFTYRQDTFERIPTSGPATLIDATFYVAQPVPGMPELSLAATFVQRGNRPTVERRIIPLDSMSNTREVGT